MYRKREKKTIKEIERDSNYYEMIRKIQSEIVGRIYNYKFLISSKLLLQNLCKKQMKRSLSGVYGIYTRSEIVYRCQVSYSTEMKMIYTVSPKAGIPIFYVIYQFFPNQYILHFSDLFDAEHNHLPLILSINENS